ncbi:MAG: hypothetical protein ACK5AZ_06800 [Bryobacteraceae bacterium]
MKKLPRTGKASLVAESGGRVAGHVLLTKLPIVTADGALDGVLARCDIRRRSG